MKQVVIFSFDSLGDLTLRQPLFTALLDAGHRVTVTVRRECHQLLPFLDERLDYVVTEIYPFGPPQANTPNQAEKLRASIAALQPQILVCPAYERTYLDEWLMSQFPEVERVGFLNPALPEPLHDNPLRSNGMLDWTTSPLFTQLITCSTDAHEAEKNRAMGQALVGGLPLDPYQPRLALPENLSQQALNVLKTLKLEARHYVLGCPAGAANIQLKAWPVESYLVALTHLWQKHHLPVLLVGLAGEASWLYEIAQAAQSQGIDVPVWIGGGEDLGLLLGLIQHSRLYVGVDTGPMHFAGALGVPVVALFGGGHWPRFLPLARPCFVATQQLPCFNCGWNCWLNEAMCIRLTSSEVWPAGLDWILSQAKDECRIELGRELAPMMRVAFQRGMNVVQTIEADQAAKEGVIQSLHHQLVVKEEIIQTLRSELAGQEKIIQALQNELTDTEKASQTLQSELVGLEEMIQSQQNELIAKEQVIQSLIIFKRSSLHYWTSHLLQLGLNKFTSLRTQDKLRQVYRRFFLGKLHQQYDPIPLKIPPRYYETPIPTNTLLPLVSIVTPSFNHAQFLERTINSVIGQNYPHLEYIIQDGASTDGTAQILEKYGPKFKHVESRQDKGQANALNLGFSHAAGDIMAWLNSDDLLLPGTVSYVVDFFLKHPEIDVVYGHRVNIDGNDDEVGRWLLPTHDDQILLWADYIPQETLFWRRRLWDHVGGYIDEFYQFALDWELLLRFRQAGARFARLPRFLGAFKVPSGSKKYCLV